MNISVYIQNIGASTIAILKSFYEIMELGYDTVIGLISPTGRKHLSLQQIINQVLFTGIDAVVIVSLIALCCGITIAVQAITNMPKIGAGEYFGTIMVIAVVRELGPFFTSIIVIGRSGAALAAYIGNMHVTREISALGAMGVNLTHFLVMPAFIGMLISLICLNIYFDLIAIVGGLLIAKIIVNIPFQPFLIEVLQALTITDIIVSFIKCVLFGSVIAIISCYHGLGVDNIRIVPRAVFRAVVGSIVVTILFNVFLTIGFYAF